MNKVNLCIRCGSNRGDAWQPCPKCSFQPTSEEDHAKSIILSNEYFIDGEYYGKTDEEFLAIGMAIQNGHPYQFNDAEVLSLTTRMIDAMSVPKRTLALEYLRFASPLIGGGGALALYLYFRH